MLEQKLNLYKRVGYLLRYSYINIAHMLYFSDIFLTKQAWKHITIKCVFLQMNSYVYEPNLSTSVVYRASNASWVFRPA